MGVVSDLCAAVELPRMIRVKQLFDRAKIEK